MSTKERSILRTANAIVVGVVAICVAGSSAYSQPRSNQRISRVEALHDLEAMASRYESIAVEQQGRIRAILKREYDERLATLNFRYAEKLAAAKKVKKQKQLELIAMLEKFIKDYPRHPKQTPEALYKLARLYFDQSETAADEDETGATIADYEPALVIWERIIKEFPEYRQLPQVLYLYASYVPTRPPAQPLEERRALQAYLALVCANKHKAFDNPPVPPTREQTKVRLESRVLDNPYGDCQPHKYADPELVHYGWIRGVAPNHFATPGEMDEAIAAYQIGIADGEEGTLFEEAQYMLAWSYYRRDFLKEAIGLFDKSVVLYDKLVAAKKKPKINLRDEALQYLAVSFTDPWQGEVDSDPFKAMQRASAFYQGRESEPHVRDFWVTMGNAFVDLGLPFYEKAIESYRKAVGAPWELHPDNPVVHQEIVNALDERGMTVEASQERAELATRYAPCPASRKATRQPGDVCGRWYDANETNRKAMQNYAQIGERMLYAAAVNTYAAAVKKYKEYQDLADADPQKPIMKTQVDSLFGNAIQMYKTFLEQHPQSKDAYAFTYGLAESLFYSGKYLEKRGPDGKLIEEGAVTHYRWVLNHKDLSEEFFEDSAFKIVKAWELESNRQIAEGTVKQLQVPQLDTLPKPIQAMPMPVVHQKLRGAYDEYARIVNDPERAPRMAFNAGLVSMTYTDLEDALKRFNVVVERYCKNADATDQVVRAKESMLAIHLARGERDKFKQTALDFNKLGCGSQAARDKNTQQIRRLEFQSADELVDAGKVKEGALAFYVYFKKTPAADETKAEALFNSAQLYERSGLPKTANGLYKEFSKRAESKDVANAIFRNSPYRLTAMMLTAESQARSYRYRDAANTYLEIYNRLLNPGRFGLQQPQKTGGGSPLNIAAEKLNAVYNAALYLELARDPKAAISRYRQYMRLEGDRKKKDQALWDIVRIVRATSSVYDTEKIYREWLRAYGSDPSNAAKRIDAYHDLAKRFGKAGGRYARTQAASYRSKVISEWAKVADPTWQGLSQQDQRRAARTAGEYQFVLKETEFRRTWAAFKLNKAPKDAADSVKKREDLAKKAVTVITSLEELYKYGKYGAAWPSMAAKVYVAKVYLGFADKVYSMPPPKNLVKLDAKFPDKNILGRYEAAIRKWLDHPCAAAQQCQSFRAKAQDSLKEVVNLATQRGITNRWVTEAKDLLNKEFNAGYPVLNDDLVDGVTTP